MSIQDHAAAVLARLGSSGTPALTVYDGEAPEPPDVPVLPSPPYVLARFTARALGARDRPDASNLVMQSLPLEVTGRFYLVGGNARASRALQQRVMTALLDWEPVVAGRSCSPMRHIDTWETPPDEQTGTTYYELGDEYRFTSHPA